MRRLAWVAPLLAVGLGACGGMSDSERFQLRTPGTDKTVVREIAGSQKIRTGKPTKTEVEVIRGWADALRAGHDSAAAQFFALPVLVADGLSPLHSLKKRADVVHFNKALPCGARLVKTKRGESSFVIAQFKLTERPGRGQCGAQVGNDAYTAFLIERHRIVQWRGALPQPAQSGSSGSG